MSDDEGRKMPTLRRESKSRNVVSHKVRGFVDQAKNESTKRTLKSRTAVTEAEIELANATIKKMHAQQEFLETVAKSETYDHEQEKKKSKAEYDRAEKEVERQLDDAEHEDELARIRRMKELKEANKELEETEHDAELSRRRREEELKEPRHQLTPEEQKERREKREEAERQKRQEEAEAVLKTGAFGPNTQEVIKVIDSHLLEKYGHTNSEAPDVSEEDKANIAQLRSNALEKDLDGR